jgi:putative peptidoglycan lipid II flippase
MPDDQTASRNRFFSSSRNLAISTLISRILGLVREQLTAYVIGGGALMSGWTLALTWANTFRRILGEGELGKAIVPILSLSLEKEGVERARDRFSTILLWLTLLLTALAVVLGVPSWLIARTLEPGRWKTAFELFPILAPYMVFICIVGAATACANVLREFFLPSLTAILQNAVLILALMLVCRRFEGMTQLKSFGLAVLVAGVFEMALIFLILWRRGMMVRVTRAIVRDSETLLSIWKLVLPGLLGASALQLSLQCDRLVAGFIGDYAASSLYYSERLVYLPVGIFAVSFATVANTELSRFAAAGNYDELTAMLEKTIRILLFVSIPFAAFMVCFPQSIISLFFQQGRFDETAMRETAYAFLMYSAGIPLFSVFKISSVAFTSRRDMVTPLKVSLFCISLNIVLNFALMVPLRQGGIALATIVSSLLNNTLLLTIYNRQLPEHKIDFRALGLYLLKLIPACGLPLIPAFLIFRLIVIPDGLDLSMLPHGDLLKMKLTVGVPLLAAGIVYGIGLLALCMLFRIDETGAVLGRFLRRKKRSA